MVFNYNAGMREQTSAGHIFRTFTGLTLLFIFWGSTIQVSGQSKTLIDCIRFATINNKNLQMAGLDVEVAKKKSMEKIGSLLPQIDGSASYTDNKKLQRSVISGDLLGKPGELLTITMGSKYSASGSLQLSQKILDPALFVALKASKVNTLSFQQSQQKTLEQTYYNVSNAYYKYLITNRQCTTLKNTLASQQKNLETTVLKFKNGRASSLDVKKVTVSCNSTKAQLEQSELSCNQALNDLKYQIGMPVDSALLVDDTSSVGLNPENAYQALNADFNIDKRIDYQQQKTNLIVQELQKKEQMAGYLPTLSFSAVYSYNAMRNEFNLLKKGLPWYNSYNIGFSLKIPVFDGFQRNSRLAQSRINIKKAQENILLTEQTIRLNVSNFEIQYKNALDNIRTEKENLDLAQEVLNTTQIQYKEGTATSLDLIQAESSFRESQNTYYNKLMTLFTARLDLEQSKGTLISYINNLN